MRLRQDLALSPQIVKGRGEQKAAEYHQLPSTPLVRARRALPMRCFRQSEDAPAVAVGADIAAATSRVQGFLGRRGCEILSCAMR